MAATVSRAAVDVPAEAQAQAQAVAVPPRRFFLWRRHDPTGTSGCGRVAEGCSFGRAGVILVWNAPPYSIGIFGCIADVEDVHGHGGATTVRWVD